jgi:RNA ligase (TIGR02306 family)
MLIENIKPHNNADNLEIAQILGYSCVVKKGVYTAEEEVGFIEPGIGLSEEYADNLSLRQYLKKKVDLHGCTRWVVKEVKLRGQMSEGIIIPLEYSPSSTLEACKFEPPPAKYSMADAVAEHKEFPAFGSLINLRHHPRQIVEGTIVAVTEKIHGTNSRVGYRVDPDTGEVIWLAGSRKLNRKEPQPGSSSLYWMPFELCPGIKKMFMDLVAYGFTSATLYGELYGPKIQRFNYGLKDCSVGYAAFHLAIERDLQEEGGDSHWREPEYGIPCAPLLDTEFEYSYEALVEKFGEGPTALSSKARHLREGVVIIDGTNLYKYVADSYLLGPGQDEPTDL